ncbi:CPBP family intramembrane glutamic endopeptidase [Roseateles chitinivorans]|uniref:CPBP family intramembrane glutamic endopeptidase n=1 Tax=Roseateles chitinivorans TaxID=2917965 RepID=UPI003D67E193
MISNPIDPIQDIDPPIEFLGRAAKRFLEFTLLLLSAAAVCVLVGITGRAVLDAVAADPTRRVPPLWGLSLICVQMLAALWMLSLLKRGDSLRTLFRIRLRATLGLAVGATALILAAALLVDCPAILTNGFYPINPNVHPELWETTLATMAISAFLEELFHRALLQPLIARLFSSEVAGLVGAAVIFTAMHAKKDVVLIIPGALLLGLVFLRTRSVVCTTVLHLAMTVTLDLLKGRSLMVSPLLSPEEFAPMRPAIGLALVLLAIAFECWHRRADRRAMPTPPNERIANAAAEPTSV